MRDIITNVYITLKIIFSLVKNTIKLIFSISSRNCRIIPGYLMAKSAELSDIKGSRKIHHLAHP